MEQSFLLLKNNVSVLLLSIILSDVLTRFLESTHGGRGLSNNIENAGKNKTWLIILCLINGIQKTNTNSTDIRTLRLIHRGSGGEHVFYTYVISTKFRRFS